MALRSEIIACEEDSAERPPDHRFAVRYPCDGTGVIQDKLEERFLLRSLHDIPGVSRATSCASLKS